MHRKITCLLLGLAAVGTMLLMSAAPASALLTRPVTLSFGSDGTAGTTFGNPVAVAFLQSSKKLYVLNQSPNGIYGFDASSPGTYTPLAGFAPLSTTNPSGYPGFGVDGSGNIFMSTENSSNLYGFDSSGNPLAAFGGAGGSIPRSNRVPPMALQRTSAAARSMGPAMSGSAT